jgi:hypothetical protein
MAWEERKNLRKGLNPFGGFMSETSTPTSYPAPKRLGSSWEIYFLFNLIGFLLHLYPFDKKSDRTYGQKFFQSFWFLTISLEFSIRFKGEKMDERNKKAYSNGGNQKVTGKTG